MSDPLITQAAIEAAACVLQARFEATADDPALIAAWEDIDEDDRRVWREWASASLTAAMPHLLAALAAQAGEPPERLFIGVSADRPMEVQFTPADGPGGGFCEYAEAERWAAAATAAERERNVKLLREAVTRDEITRTAPDRAVVAGLVLSAAADLIEKVDTDA